MNYRIHPDILLQIVKSSNYSNYQEFITSDNLGNEEIFKQSVIEDISVLNKTVWNTGIYSARLNKVFNSSNLIEFADINNPKNYRSKNCSLLLRQGFSWNNIFGILVVIKGMTSGYIYTSQLMTIDDFQLNFEISRELIDNAFWTSEKLFSIPDLGTDENLMVSIENILFSDVINSGPEIGLITTYPKSIFNFESLVSEAPLPSYIDVSINISETHYINIQPVTLQPNKTVEQSLLDYFNLSKNIVPIEISHVIKYGTDDNGFKTIRISNEDNIYGLVSVGLDFNQTVGTNVMVFVSTEFKVNNILLKREHSLLFDYNTVLNPILDNIILRGSDLTVFPVNVTKETTINHNVIQQETEQKIVTITQPVYIELVKEDIIFENKNISFENIMEYSYMIIKDSKTGIEQFIQAKNTADNKFYFSLTNISKPEINSTFTIISSVTNLLIGKGKFIN